MTCRTTQIHQTALSQKQNRVATWKGVLIHLRLDFLLDDAREGFEFSNLTFLMKLPMKELDLSRTSIPESGLQQLPRMARAERIIVAPKQLSNALMSALKKAKKTVQVTPK